MKKILLSASMLMLAGASFAATDNATYEDVDGFKCENLWVLDRVHTESDYLASKIASKNARTATTDGTTVYVGLSDSDNGASIEKFDLKTGAYLGSLAVTKDGEAVTGTLAVNQVGFDEYGHFYAATFAPNSDGAGQYNVYTVDLQTGALTAVGDLLFDGNVGRVDFCDVIGDITGVEAQATIMAVASSQDNTNVFQWVREQGSDEWLGGWTDQAVAQQINADQTYPSGVVGFSYGSVIKMVRDGSKSGEMSMFYIDGFTSLPALYGSDGAMIDNLGNADLIVEDKETKEVISGTLPEPAQGTNGIAEGVVNESNLMIYSEGQYDAPHCCQAIVTSVNEDMAFESMKYLWTVPADGLGNVSDGGVRAHSLFCLSQEDGSALLLTYKCFNGLGAYKITKEGGSVESNVVATAKITVNGDVIAVSEQAQSIEVYNIAGQKVAEAHNASQVAAPATGAYIVKAVVAGTPVVKKVIL